MRQVRPGVSSICITDSQAVPSGAHHQITPRQQILYVYSKMSGAGYDVVVDVDEEVNLFPILHASARTANLSRVISATLTYKRISNSTPQTSTPINPQVGESYLAPLLASLLPRPPAAAPRNASSGPYPSIRNSSTWIPALCCRDAGPHYTLARTFWMYWRGILISMGRFGLRRRLSSFCS